MFIVLEMSNCSFGFGLDLVNYGREHDYKSRQCQGAVLGPITQIEKDIAKLEGKTTLWPNDRLRIKHLLEEQGRSTIRKSSKIILKSLISLRKKIRTLWIWKKKAYYAHDSGVMKIHERLEQLRHV